jgi:hypothetical protein
MEEIKKVIPEFKNSNIRPLVGTLEKIYHKTMRC